MLCNSCRRSLLSRPPSFTNHTRFLPSRTSCRSVTTAPTTPTANQSEPPPPSLSVQNRAPPTISSSTLGTSQPLSAPQLSSSGSAQTAPASGTKARRVLSSTLAGQELKGLGYLKAKPNILAKEDEEYPNWLWSILDNPKSKLGLGAANVDLSALTKKQRAKYDRKQSKLLKSIPKQVPIHEQSRDLTNPGDDAVTSLDRRQEIVKSSRVARRKGIREDNFLRGM